MTGPQPAVGKVGDIGQSMAQCPVTRVLRSHERRSPSVSSSAVRSEAAAELWLPWVELGRPWGANWLWACRGPRELTDC